MTELRLDLGCGKNKYQEAGKVFTGVDSIQMEGVDVVCDLRLPWPWPDSSVDEVRSSHFFEHLTQTERCHFWNELFRVLKPGAQAVVIAPYWSHSCAYGDPTHQWPPVTEWAVYYTNQDWRNANAPHANEMLKCDFDFVFAGTWDPWLEFRNNETKQFAMTRNINSYRDIIFTLTKTFRGLTPPAQMQQVIDATLGQGVQPDIGGTTAHD